MATDHLDEVRRWNAARLLAAAADDVDEEDEKAMKQQEFVERLRRSDSDLRARQNVIDNKDDIDVRLRDTDEHCNSDNWQKRHRRPPVDPTLLMMGIGKRK